MENNVEHIVRYKKTKIGLIPDDWNIYILKDILEEYKLGGNYANSDNYYNTPLIKMGNLGRGHITLDKIEYLRENESINEDDLLNYGDVLFNTRNTLELVGKVAIWKNELEKAVYNSNILRLKFNELVRSNFFMNYCLNSYSSIKELRRIATGTTSVAAIYTKDLLKIKIALPPLPEQQKIANILSDWDTAIENVQTLFEKLQLRKKGFMQQLLTGRERLPGFSEDWRKVRIKEIATQFTDKNKDNDEIEVLSCTKYDGLVRSLDYFGRKVFGDDLSKYKIVPSGYFAYATNHIEEGSIGYQNLMEKGLVSPMYTVFKTDEVINDSFMYRLLKTDRMIYKYQSNMSGSITRRGGLRWNVFETIIVNIPSLAEQNALADFFDIIDKEIDQSEKYLKQLRVQKKGLMQQLLTGKIRVNTNINE